MSKFQERLRYLRDRHDALAEQAVSSHNEHVGRSLDAQVERIEAEIATLEPLAEVAEAVERLEAENKELKRRLEALEQLVGTLPGVQRVELVADTTTICPQCWGKKFWKEAPANDPGNFKHYVCGTCQGTGRVQA